MMLHKGEPVIQLRVGGKDEYKRTSEIVERAKQRAQEANAKVEANAKIEAKVNDTMPISAPPQPV